MNNFRNRDGFLGNFCKQWTDKIGNGVAEATPSPCKLSFSVSLKFYCLTAAQALCPWLLSPLFSADCCCCSGSDCCCYCYSDCCSGSGCCCCSDCCSDCSSYLWNLLSLSGTSRIVPARGRIMRRMRKFFEKFPAPRLPAGKDGNKRQKAENTRAIF